MIRALHLNNFCAFRAFSMDLSAGVNVIVGENGTGKTHLLKALYGLGCVMRLHGGGGDARVVTDKLVRIFVAGGDGRLGELFHAGGVGKAKVGGEFGGGGAVALEFGARAEVARVRVRAGGEWAGRAVYLPSKEILSFARRLANGVGREAMAAIFDDGHLDAMAAVLPEEAAGGGRATAGLNPALYNLVALMGGEFRWRDGDFCFCGGKVVDRRAAAGGDKKRERNALSLAYADYVAPVFEADGGRMHGSALTAEGFRKIGILQRLIARGALSDEGGDMLLWDEPDANLNPAMTRMVARVLLELGRLGHQVVLATHDYVLLKWFDLLARKTDGVRYHSVYRDEEGEVALRSSGHYLDIQPNSLSEIHNDLLKVKVGLLAEEAVR